MRREHQILLVVFVFGLVSVGNAAPKPMAHSVGKFAVGSVAIDVPDGWFPVVTGPQHDQLAILSPVIEDKFQINVALASVDDTTCDEWVSTVTAQKHKIEGGVATIKWRGGVGRELTTSSEQGLRAIQRCLSVDTGVVLIQGLAPVKSFEKHRAQFKTIFESATKSDPLGDYQPALIRTLLVPVERGGTDQADNQTWLFESAAHKKDMFDLRLKAHTFQTDDVCETKTVPQFDTGRAYPKALAITSSCKSGKKFDETIQNTP